MANGSGAEIDGGGSVRWVCTNVDDDTTKGESLPHGPRGRKTKGVDKAFGAYFKVELIVPDMWTAEFVAQFTGAAGKKAGDTITFYLPILNVNKQIQVHWTPGIEPPRQGPGQGPSSSGG